MICIPIPFLFLLSSNIFLFFLKKKLYFVDDVISASAEIFSDPRTYLRNDVIKSKIRIISAPLIEIGPVAIILLEVKILRDHDRLSISKLQDNKSIFFVKHIEINLQKLKMDGQEPQKDVSFKLNPQLIDHVTF